MSVERLDGSLNPAGLLAAPNADADDAGPMDAATNVAPMTMA
jgi:hypothetical protein